VLLQETLAELDEAAGEGLSEDAERLELFRLATRKAVIAAQGGLWPRQGHNAYTNEPVREESAAVTKRLDLRS
jgi:hypothetical protein